MEEFVQLLSVLLSLSDFGVAQSTKAPPPSDVTKYGVEDADVFLFVDLEPLVGKNVRAFVALREKKELQAAPPEVRAAVDRAMRELETAREQAKKTIGVDPVTDVRSIAVWVKLGTGEPTGVMAVRGNFRPTWVDGLAHLGRDGFEVDGQKALVVGDAVVARTRDGQALIGTRALVEERLKKGWKPPAARAGSAAAEVRAALGEQPLFVGLFAPAPAARTLVLERADEPAVRDVLAGLAQFRFSVLRNGVSWRYVAIDRSGYEAAVLASQGTLELMRASHLFARGAARLILSAVRTHARSEPRLQAIVAREKDLLRLVAELTGDGRFTATVSRAPAKNTVTVKATGRTLSQVVPVAGIFPLAAAGALAFGVRKEAAAPEAQASAPPAAVPAPVPGSRPIDVRGVYQRAKRKRAGAGSAR